MKPVQKYHSRNSNAQSWEYIEDFFLNRPGMGNLEMAELAKHIKESNLSGRLYGTTTKLKPDNLVVSVYDPIDVKKESLHITFNLQHKTWHFEYFAMPFEEPEFVRTYAEDLGMKKFDNFVKTIRW